MTAFEAVPLIKPPAPRGVSNFGFLIRSEIGDRAMGVMLVGPKAPRKDTLYNIVMASRGSGKDGAAFDTKDSPIGALRVKAGPDTVKIEDFFDGYVFIALRTQWRRVGGARPEGQGRRQHSQPAVFW